MLAEAAAVSARARREERARNAPLVEELREAWMGKRVRVWWEPDGKYYMGVVVDIHSPTNIHVMFDKKVGGGGLYGVTRLHTRFVPDELVELQE